jgi:rieske iron-sulfur protein
MIERRAVLLAGLGLGLGLSVEARNGGAERAAAQGEGASARPKEGDLLVKAGDSTNTPLTPADIAPGAGPTMAWAMDPGDRSVRSGSRLNQLLLLRFDPQALAGETRSRAADGVVAYTAICTHTGCEVEEWRADEQHLECECHFSVFDPKDGGKPVDGPAPRALPALPLKIADGRLVVAKPFVTPVGFEKG